VGVEPEPGIDNAELTDFTRGRNGPKGRNGGCLYKSVQFVRPWGEVGVTEPANGNAGVGDLKNWRKHVEGAKTIYRVMV
jgi:hypothetical protein